jgi:hypothetical protein
MAHRLAWLYMYGFWLSPRFEFDHINGCKTDNRRCNFAACNSFAELSEREKIESQHIRVQRRLLPTGKNGGRISASMATGSASAALKPPKPLTQPMPPLLQSIAGAMPELRERPRAYRSPRRQYLAQENASAAISCAKSGWPWPDSSTCPHQPGGSAKSQNYSLILT